MLKIERRWLIAGAGNLIAAAVLGKSQARAEDAGLLDFSALKLQSPPVLAPDVSFKTEDGTDKPLSDWRGKGVVLNFWATWCPPCVAELPSLDRLSQALAGSGIEVVAVSEDLGAVAAAKVRAYYAAHGIGHLPVLVDRYGKAADALGNQGVPETLLIDAQGKVRARFEGGTDWSGDAAVAKVRALVG
jgi:thiol-disulfide isomerase/thioredoxin